MITSLFRQASGSKPAEENNNKDTRKALTQEMPGKASPRAEGSQTAADQSEWPTPENIDQLSRAVHALLMNSKLEVGKVRPFFWSMVEAYVDRFHIYPFDVVKAMFSYLETRDFPADEVRELVKKLEDGYLQQHGQPLRISTRMVCEEDSFDDELKALRESLKYAAMVGELEEQAEEQA